MAQSVANNYFPSQVVSDLEKMSYEYGLKVAKAIQGEWFGDETNVHGNSRYNNVKNNFFILCV